MSQQNQIKLFETPGQFSAYLRKSEQSIAAALPHHLKADRMIRLAVTCFSTTPDLRKCTPDSLLASLIIASQVGLEPGIVGQAYLIPYFNARRNVHICTFIPGWQGLVGLLNNSGRATAWTGAVFEGDEFDYELGSKPFVKHRPGDNHGEVAKLTHVYACGKVNGSEIPVIEVWSKAKVFKHRDRYNKVGNKHYSFNHFEMYARKVALVQVLKYMPRSIELQNAMTAADAGEMGNIPRVEGGIIIDVDGATDMGDDNNQTPDSSNGAGEPGTPGSAGEGSGPGPGGPETPEGGLFAQQQAPQSAQSPVSGKRGPKEPPSQKPAESKAAPEKLPPVAKDEDSPFDTATPKTEPAPAPPAEPHKLQLLRVWMAEQKIEEAEVIDVCNKLKIGGGQLTSLGKGGEALAGVLFSDRETLEAHVTEWRKKKPAPPATPATGKK